MIKLYHGDFLEKAKSIPDDSVDLVLTDPPYGTVKSLRLKNQKDNVYGWDEAIEPKVLFTEINRILRKNGKAVLFGQEPFTSRMITEAIPNLPFSYRMIWEKDHFANGLGSKKAPVNYYEDVMVFSKKESYVKEHPLKEVFTKYTEKYGDKFITDLYLKHGRYSTYKSARVHASNQFGFNHVVRFKLLDEDMYNYLSEHIEFEEPYEELKAIDEKHKKRLASTFNIWEEEPVKDFEDVMVFNKQDSLLPVHPLKKTMLKYVEKYSKEYIVELFEKEGRYTSPQSARVHASYKFGFNNGTRFDLMDESLYKFMSGYIDFGESYEELKAIDDEYKKQVASTFNLWQKKKTKSNILKYAKDYPSLHPTQKPVLLLEDLVKTFSNEGDLVVDLTMGSGSTGVACKNTGRKFIGIEMDDEYFKIAKERIESHEQQLELV